MENNHTSIPTKVEEKYSFMDFVRKLLNKTSKVKDAKGRIKYISYPPKKGFSSKQKNEIVELEINDVPIIGENRDISIRELLNLRRLSLGRGVIAITEGAISQGKIRTLELSDTVKQIPPGAITKSSIKTVQGKDFCITSNSTETVSDIYIDTDERLHYIEAGHISLGLSDYIHEHSDNMEDFIYENTERITNGILSNSRNKNTLYIYDEGKPSSGILALHAVLDEFPMPGSRTKTFSDDRLIGILINGKEEVDLKQLSAYPNLQSIYIGENVKRVLATKDLTDTNIVSQDRVAVKKQKSISGKTQKVNLISKDTLLLTSSGQGTNNAQKSLEIDKKSEMVK